MEAVSVEQKGSAKRPLRVLTGSLGIGWLPSPP